MTDLVAFIKDYAQTHYEEGGWDVIVECWSDEEVANDLREFGASNETEALAVFKPLVSIWADRQADARNSR